MDIQKKYTSTEFYMQARYLTKIKAQKSVYSLWLIYKL
jgi:hypothetical protein